MRKEMRKGIFRVVVLLLAILVPAIVFCQDTVKVSASFINTADRSGVAIVEDFQGFSVDADFKIKSFNNFRIGGVFNYQAPAVDDIKNLGIYSVGPQISYRVGPVEPFAGAYFGLTTFYGNRMTGDSRKNLFTRVYRVGVDIPFAKESKFFLRPLFVQWIGTEGFRDNVVKSIGAGAGVRF